MYYGVEDFLEKVAAKQKYDFSDLSDEELNAAIKDPHVARAYTKLVPIAVGSVAGGALGGRALGKKIGTRYGNSELGSFLGTMAGMTAGSGIAKSLKRPLIANDDDIYYVNALGAEFNKREGIKDADKQIENINRWRNK